jgi:hypothetical protein
MRNKVIEDRTTYNFSELSNIDYNQKEMLRMEFNILDKQLEQKINQKEYAINALEAQLKTAQRYKDEAAINKSELDKSIRDREQFQKRVNESNEIIENEKNKLIDLTKKSEKEREELIAYNHETQNKLKDSEYALNKERNVNLLLNNNNSSLKAQIVNIDDLRSHLNDKKQALDAERNR